MEVDTREDPYDLITNWCMLRLRNADLSQKLHASRRFDIYHADLWVEPLTDDITLSVCNVSYMDAKGHYHGQFGQWWHKTDNYECCAHDSHHNWCPPALQVSCKISTYDKMQEYVPVKRIPYPDDSTDDDS